MATENNATYLFQKSPEDREKKFYNSESWWTAFFTMLALLKQETNSPLELPFYSNEEDAIARKNNGNVVSFEGFSYQSMAADAKLNAKMFEADWDNKYLSLRPDITFIQPNERKVIFIETKTFGANAQRNIDRYSELTKHLKSNNWEVDFYYLLSLGHETKGDWRRLVERQEKFILWEDVLEKARDSDLFNIFDKKTKDMIESILSSRKQI